MTKETDYCQKVLRYNLDCHPNRNEILGFSRCILRIFLVCDAMYTGPDERKKKRNRSPINPFIFQKFITKKYCQMQFEPENLFPDIESMNTLFS